jgi:hypothetical protein
LQLEVLRGGTGSGRPTAVGLDSPGDEDPDHPLQKVPLWFALMMPVTRPYVRQWVEALPQEQRKLMLSKSRLSRRYRVLLSWRWKFELEETISQSDAEKLVANSNEQKDTRFFESVEKRAVWHIWQYMFA